LVGARVRPDGNDGAAGAVNEYEGAVLGVIARVQPVTRYRLLKSFEQSATTSYNTSKGSLYPLIGRMIDRGFVRAEPAMDGRQGQLLTLTPAGQAAHARWLTNAEPQLSLGHDALFSRVLSLKDLTRDEQVAWVASAKAMLLDRRDQLAAAAPDNAGPYGDIVQDSAIALLTTKLEWLDRLLIRIVKP